MGFIYQMVYEKEERKLLEDEISLLGFASLFIISFMKDRSMVNLKRAPSWITKMKGIQTAIALLAISSLIGFKTYNPDKWITAPHLKKNEIMLKEAELLTIGKE